MSDKLAFDYQSMGLGDSSFQPIIFVFMDFPSWPIFLHTGVGYITWQKEDWLGAGRIGTIENVSEGIGLKSGRMRLTLAPVLNEYLYDALNESSWGRAVEMYLGTWASDGSGFYGGKTPELFIRGVMSSPVINMGVQETVIGVEVEDIRGMLDRIHGLRSTILDHQESAPGDKFYEFLPAMLDHTFVFNGRDATSFQPANGEYGPGSPRWLPMSER